MEPGIGHRQENGRYALITNGSLLYLQSTKPDLMPGVAVMKGSCSCRAAEKSAVVLWMHFLCCTLRGRSALGGLGLFCLRGKRASVLV